MRKQLGRIKASEEEADVDMADGGRVPTRRDDVPFNKKEAEKFAKGFNESGFNPDRWKKNLKEGLGLHEGGVAHLHEGGRVISSKKLHRGGEINEGKDFAEEDIILRKEDIDRRNREAMDSGKPQEPYPEDIQDTLRHTDVTPGRKKPLYNSGGEVSEGPQHSPASSTVSHTHIEALHQRINELESILKEKYDHSSKVQKFKDGGDVKSEEESYTVPSQPLVMAPPAEQSLGERLGSALSGGISDATNAFKNVVSPVAQFGSDFVKGAIGMPEANAAEVEKPMAMRASPQGIPVQVPADMQPTAPAPTATPVEEEEKKPAFDPVMAGFEQQKLGLAQQAAADIKQGQDEARTLADFAKHQQEAAQEFAKQEQHLNTQRDQLKQAIDQQKIDPRRYIERMSTGDKVMTTIGLILGGLGAGLTGKENQAATILNKQIDDDIKSQEMELGKKQNLLSENLKELGNLQSARQMTRMMMNDIVDAQLKQVAARAKDPQAKARLLMASGELQMKQGLYAKHQAQETAVNNLQAKAKTNPAMYPALIDSLEKIDPKKAADMRERLVPGLGLANSSKDASEAKEIMGSAQKAEKTLNQLYALSNKPGKTLSLDDRAEANSLRRQLMGEIRVPILGPGTVNDAERKILEDLVPDVTSFFSRDASNQIKLDTLTKKIKDGMQFHLKARGIGGNTTTGMRQIPEGKPVFAKK